MSESSARCVKLCQVVSAERLSMKHQKKIMSEWLHGNAKIKRNVKNRLQGRNKIVQEWLVNI